MALYTAHYGEIAIKGKNRYIFENKLIANIKNALGKIKNNLQPTVFGLREKKIFFETEDAENSVKETLSHIFGIEWYARVYKVEKDKEKIREFTLEKLNELKVENKTIKVETKRADKSLPFTSMELSSEIGAAIVEKFGCKVDLHKPDIKIYIEIMHKNDAFVYFEKIKGAGGLPVGSSGKIIALLSGGIDSPVASWMIMSRGAKVIFLHVHSFANEKEVEKSKITELIEKLAKWQNGAKIYFADYSEFYKKAFSIPPAYELVMFRVFIHLLAQAIAKKEMALAIVNGDSLGQVASQTLENIYAINSGFEMPVFRPLIGMSKNEIINKAEKIGTYKISIKTYKDCCSLVAQKPETKASPKFVKQIEEKININEIVSKTLEKIKILEIPT